MTSRARREPAEAAGETPADRCAVAAKAVRPILPYDWCSERDFRLCNGHSNLEPVSRCRAFIGSCTMAVLIQSSPAGSG